MFLSKATHNKYICQKKVKQYISVGTVRMFIEPSAKHLHLKGNPFHVYNTDSSDKMLHKYLFLFFIFYWSITLVRGTEGSCERHVTIR